MQQNYLLTNALSIKYSTKLWNFELTSAHDCIYYFIFKGQNHTTQEMNLRNRRYIPPWMLFETKNKVNVTKSSTNVKPATVYLGNGNLRKLLRKSAMILDKVLAKIPHGKSQKKFHNFQRKFLHFYQKYIQHWIHIQIKYVYICSLCYLLHFWR